MNDSSIYSRLNLKRALVKQSLLCRGLTSKNKNKKKQKYKETPKITFKILLSEKFTRRVPGKVHVNYFFNRHDISFCFVFDAYNSCVCFVPNTLALFRCLWLSDFGPHFLILFQLSKLLSLVRITDNVPLNLSISLVFWSWWNFFPLKLGTDLCAYIRRLGIILLRHSVCIWIV